MVRRRVSDREVFTTFPTPPDSMYGIDVTSVTYRVHVVAGQMVCRDTVSCICVHCTVTKALLIRFSCIQRLFLLATILV